MLASDSACICPLGWDTLQQISPCTPLLDSDYEHDAREIYSRKSPPKSKPVLTPLLLICAYLGCLACPLHVVCVQCMNITISHTILLWHDMCMSSRPAHMQAWPAAAQAAARWRHWEKSYKPGVCTLMNTCTHRAGRLQREQRLAGGAGLKATKPKFKVWNLNLILKSTRTNRAGRLRREQRRAGGAGGAAAAGRPGRAAGGDGCAGRVRRRGAGCVVCACSAGCVARAHARTDSR